MKVEDRKLSAQMKVLTKRSEVQIISLCFQYAKDVMRVLTTLVHRWRNALMPDSHFTSERFIKRQTFGKILLNGLVGTFDLFKMTAFVNGWKCVDVLTKDRSLWDAVLLILVYFIWCIAYGGGNSKKAKIWGAKGANFEGGAYAPLYPGVAAYECRTEIDKYP